MSIFRIFSVKHKFYGTIQTKEDRKFGYFSMQTDNVKCDFSATFDKINKNIKAKSILGTILFCKFVKHDGNSILQII